MKPEEITLLVCKRWGKEESPNPLSDMYDCDYFNPDYLLGRCEVDIKLCDAVKYNLYNPETHKVVQK